MCRIAIEFLIGAFILSGVYYSLNAKGEEKKGLVGYWSFDEGKGNIAKDSSKNDNDGKIIGAEWVDGKFGKALKFNGVDTYVDCGNDQSLNFPDRVDFSIELWFKANPSHKGQVLFSKGDGFHPDQWTIRNGSLECIAFRNNDRTLWGGWGWGSLFDRKWHHVAVIVDRDGDTCAYVDGQPKGTIASSEWWGAFENNVNFNIGRRSLVGDEYFNGIIDEVKIYKKVLTEDEVRWSYLRGYPERVRRPKGSLFVEDFGQELFVTGESYRLHFKKGVGIFTFEISTFPRI